MQVDLFKSRAFLGNYKKVGKQVETRKFSIDPCIGRLEDIEKHVTCYNEGALNEYKNRLQSLVDSGRQYDHIGEAGSDSLFEVETLGIAKYCKRYTMILDLSDSLDYILHRLCKCDIGSIRNMSEYSRVSNAIMNYCFDDVDQILFNSFFQLDPKLDEYFAQLLAKSSNVTISSESKMDWVISKFYTEILEMACAVKDYSMTFMSSRLPNNTIAYRSKSFSSSLASVSDIFDDNVIFHQDGYEDYKVDLKYYEPFGIIKGKVFI